jgi:hypothetical protein
MSEVLLNSTKLFGTKIYYILWTNCTYIVLKNKQFIRSLSIYIELNV